MYGVNIDTCATKKKMSYTQKRLLLKFGVSKRYIYINFNIKCHDPLLSLLLNTSFAKNTLKLKHFSADNDGVYTLRNFNFLSYNKSKFFFPQTKYTSLKVFYFRKLNQMRISNHFTIVNHPNRTQNMYHVILDTIIRICLNQK